MRTMSERLRIIALTALAFLGVALIATLVEHTAGRSLRSDQSGPATFTFSVRPSSWSHVLGRNLLFWSIWGLLTAPIVWLARRSQSWPAFARVAVWLACAPVAVGVHTVLNHVLLGTDLEFTGKAPLKALGLTERSELNLLAFGLIVGFAHAALLYHALQARRHREAQLEMQLVQAELNALRMQIQPHFLFNTLNTVSSLMAEDVAAARRVLASLGDLLRHAVDSGHRQEVTLREELDFTARYIEIQRARFGSRLSVEISSQPDLDDALVPNLFLQPLVENAIRHGVERGHSSRPVTLTVSSADSRLLVTITNQVGIGSAAAAANGVGLANVRARLEQLYPDGHRFAYGRSGDEFVVTLQLPLVRS